MRSSLLALGCVTALALGLGASSAHAQRRGRRAPPAQTADTAETDRARSLFAEGVELVSGAHYEEAEARFRQALAIRDAPAIRYNLASVLFEQGEYPEAQVENDRALAADNVPDAVRTAAEELRTHLAERAAYVRFELQGAATGGSINIDGYVLTQPGLEIPVSAAPHTAVVTLRGEEVARRQVELAIGEHRVVVLGEVEAPIATGSSGGRSIDQEDWFWPVVAGGGALVVAIGIGIGVAATSGTEGPVEGNFMPGVIRWP
ncbi:MAG: tetratricopeptide repeat protein [Sandaracinaceae bacterium]|nr:tetratricopeptide repeat protein [Sandaracinaceae bacterium]